MMSCFQVDAVDTVAAGDAFIGAFAIGISEALSVRRHPFLPVRQRRFLSLDMAHNFFTLEK
jgi:sugar/nucleoside kinase (ribokinase family)